MTGAMAHLLKPGGRHPVIPRRHFSKELENRIVASRHENGFCVKSRCEAFLPVALPALRSRTGRLCDLSRARPRSLTEARATEASNKSPEIAIDAEDICLTLGQAEVR